MRTAFIKNLCKIAKRKENIFLLVGDLGYSVVEQFADEFPNRFLNAGVAEQNITGIAAGLASEGYHVFTYSIANFPTLRCLEQIRNDVCYHNLPVTIVSVGGGMAYGNLGYSHHAVQDYGIMRTLPSMRVFAPADPSETEQCMQALTNAPTPSYLRLGKAGEPILHHKRISIGRPTRLTGTADSPIAVLGVGAVLQEALAAADTDCSSNLPEIATYTMPLLHPINATNVEMLWKHQCLIVVEEHVQQAGMAETLALLSQGKTIVHSLSAKPQHAHKTGNQSALRKLHGIDKTSISKKILRLFNEIVC